MDVAKLQAVFAEPLADPSAWDTTLSRLAMELEAPLAQFVAVDAGNALLVSEFCEPYDPDLAAREPDYQEINPRYLAVPKMRVGRISFDRDYISPEQKLRDVTYQELIKR